MNVAYVDDLALVKSHDKYMLMENCQICLSMIGEWMEANQLEIALEKIGTILLRDRRA